MDRDGVWEAMIAAIREETDNPAAVVEPSMTAIDIPGWDLLAHVRIVMNMEARTGAVIEMSDTYKAATVGELCDIVLKKSRRGEQPLIVACSKAPQARAAAAGRPRG